MKDKTQNIFSPSIKRLHHFFEELKELFYAELKNDEKAKMTAEILEDMILKSKRLLDKMVYNFYEKNFNITDDEIIRIISFPI